MLAGMEYLEDDESIYSVFNRNECDIMSEAIRIENLMKSYGDHLVVKGISFEVNKGEIFALLGVNGAGKTTTLECIEGIRKYDSGTILVNGKTGVQLQSSSLQANIKAAEAFILFSKWNKAAVNWELFNNFGLSELKNKQYKDMSTGQKRRLHLAIALINNPDIIFLDEPTAGLDVEGRATLHSEIRKLKQQGKTIIIASHDMAEVETLSDRVAILKDGKIAFIGTPKQLTSETNSHIKIHIKTANVMTPDSLFYSKFEGMDQEYYVFTTENLGEGLYEILESLKKMQTTVLDIRIEHVSLEQRFIDIAKED